MPWPHLPDDFRERDRSARVDIPNRLYDPAKGHHVHDEYVGSWPRCAPSSADAARCRHVSPGGQTPFESVH